MGPHNHLPTVLCDHSAGKTSLLSPSLWNSTTFTHGSGLCFFKFNFKLQILLCDEDHQLLSFLVDHLSHIPVVGCNIPRSHGDVPGINQHH